MSRLDETERQILDAVDGDLRTALRYAVTLFLTASGAASAGYAYLPPYKPPKPAKPQPPSL